MGIVLGCTKKSWDAPKKVVVKLKEAFGRNRYEGQSKQIDLSMDELPSVKTLEVMLPASKNRFFYRAARLVEDKVLQKINS